MGTYRSANHDWKERSGRTALITGGCRGIGLGIVLGLAESGCDICIFDIITCEIDLNELSKKFAVKIAYFKVDVGSEEELKKGFDKFTQEFDGKLDILVSCAGINKNLGFLDTNYSQFTELLDVNTKGSYFISQLSCKQMIKNGTKVGSIILIGSMSAYIAIRSQRSSAYCSTKGAIRAMVAGISAESNKYGIRCNSVSPGYIKTAMTESFTELLSEWSDLSMVGRVGEPGDIAGAVLYLASDAASYVTGTDIVIDGGVTKW